MKRNPKAGQAVYGLLIKAIGQDIVRHEHQAPKGGAPDFPVKMHDGRIFSSTTASETLPHLPSPTVDFVYVDRGSADKARKLIAEKRDEILEIKEDSNEPTEA